MLINNVVLIIGLYKNIDYNGIFHWTNYLYPRPSNQCVQIALKYFGRHKKTNSGGLKLKKPIPGELKHRNLILRDF